MIEHPLALATLLAAVTAAAFAMDRRWAWAAKVGSTLLAILMGAVLSNAGLVPADSPLYGAVEGPVTSLAMAWLLLTVRLSDLKAAGRPMLLAYGLAAAGSALGAAAGAFLFRSALGQQTWRLAGTLLGTYTGGSLNFIGVGRAVGLDDSLFAGAAAADILMTAVWMAATLVLPVALARFYPTAAGGGPAGPHDVASRHPFFSEAPLSAAGLALLLALGLVLVAAADGLGRLAPAVPAVVWLTTLALAAAHLPGARDRLRGALPLGHVGLHLFFVLIGIRARVSEIVAVGMAVLVYIVLVIAIHGLVVYGAGRLLRLDLGTLSVASQAAIGGPSSALAVAVARGWPRLVLPGVAVGMLGYAAGNYLGLALAHLLRPLL